MEVSQNSHADIEETPVNTSELRLVCAVPFYQLV